MESTTLVNRVADSGIITINLEEYFPTESFGVFDIKDHLFHGLILKEKELAEAKRIFYVAATRAKEKLFLTGGYKPRKSKNTDTENESKNVLSWLMDLYPEVKNAVETGEPGHFHLKYFSLTLPEAGSLGGLGRQKQINLSGFAKGIYYARINGEVVVKLVKE